MSNNEEIDSTVADEDVEGHLRPKGHQTADDADDVEGHLRPKGHQTADDADDVEGHLRPKGHGV